MSDVKTDLEVSIKIGNCTVKNSQEEKLLGVLIDAILSFEKHVSNICRKADNKLFALSRLSACLGTDKSRLLMKAFVTPVPILSFGMDVPQQKGE